MQLKTLNIKTKPKKTILLASLAITSVIGAIILSHFSDVINLEELKRKQLLVEKTSVRSDNIELSKEGSKIDKLNFLLTEEFQGVDLNIEFKVQPYIEITQPIGEYSYEFTNVNLNKINWQVEGDTMTIDLSKSMNGESNYYNEKLNISLPKHSWDINIPREVENIDIENTSKPIDLTVLAKGAVFSGNYGKLSIHQTDSWCGYGFRFEEVVVDSLQVSTETEFSEAKRQDEDCEDKPPFSMSLGNLQANHIELNLPKNSNIDLHDLSLLQKVEWHEIEVVESEALETIEDKKIKEESSINNPSDVKN